MSVQPGNRHFKQSVVTDSKGTVIDCVAYGNTAAPREKPLTAQCPCVIDLPPAEPLDIGAAFDEAHKLAAAGKLEEAEPLYRAILAQQPDEPEVLKAYARLLGRQWRWPESLDCCLRALAYTPRDGAAWCQAGAAAGFLGRHDFAYRALGTADVCSPWMAATQWNLALAEIQRGDWSAGWERYEWGRVSGHRCIRTLAPELRRGEQVPDGTLFVWAEQGHGDTIQMLQLLPLLKKRTGAARIILEVPNSLIGLVHGQTCADRLFATVDDGHIPFGFDGHVGLMSLPYVLGLEPEDIPGDPYLTADPAKAATRCKTVGGLNVGYCWSGNAGHGNDRARSIPAETGTAFISECSKDLIWCPLTPDAFNGALRDWTATAALISRLDLVITVDTAVAHLAGALGVPVWMLHSVSGDFRWGLDSESTPWYKSMRIFRQTRFMEWGDVFERIAAELRGLVGKEWRREAKP